ncbi:hypothetical protein F4803DRAFT_121510 [Xylaria telfairii]|nr:hypothetical protein F4803DRAFT_121510 [Xylaria telfairii]
MDSVSMLSLAGIILQAVELETRWMSEWPCHYDSARQFDQDDGSSFKTDMDEIVAFLRSLSSTVEGTDMEHLVIQCVEHCEDISQMAMTLEMTNSSKRGALAPYIYHGLLSLRQQLITLVLRSIREWNDFEARDQLWPTLKSESSSDHYFAISSTYTDRFPLSGGCRSARGPALLHLLTSNIPASNRERYETNLKNDILNEIYNGTRQPSFPIQIPNPAWVKDRGRIFLQRLCYPGIGDRKAEIHDPHGTTFSWIFNPSVDDRSDSVSFRNWLSNPEPSQSLLWITAKPGAGKSTLMKYIAQAARSTFPDREHIVSYFFHSAGTPIQRSSDGFLRSALLQILSQDPGIIPMIAPSRWEALLLFGEDPKPLDLVELQQMLMSTLDQRHVKSKILFIIDALDECEKHNSYSEILGLLRKIAACPGVKVCISSRPIPQLQDAIDSALSLTLENCTGRDIEAFVAFNIETQLSMTSEASISLSIKQKLAHELTIKASGCFLWVVLVVKSIQRNLTNGKGDTDLLRFVNDIPMQLNGIYRRFMDELNASQPFVASILRFVVLSEEPVSLLRFSFMEMNLPEFVLHQEISSLSREDLYRRAQKSIEGTVSKSMGLLEVSWPESYQITAGIGTGKCEACLTIIHQSVRDFLQAEAALSAPSSHGSSYDLAARYCAASLSILKLSSIGDLTVPSVSAEAFRCAYVAMFTQTENGDVISRILDELERTCHALLEAGTITGESGFAHQGLLKQPTLWCPSDPSVAQDNKTSAGLQQRVVALCFKYGAARLKELPRGVGQWSGWFREFDNDRLISGEGDVKRGHPFIYSRESSSIKVKKDNELNAENITPQVTNSSDETGLARPNTERRNYQANFRGHPLGIVRSHPARDLFRKDELDPNDDNDNISWESLSSADVSLDESHPLVAFKAELIQTVFEGFMKYRQKCTGGKSEVS